MNENQMIPAESLRDSLDPLNLLGDSLNLHRQIEELLNFSQSWQLPKGQYRNVIIMGMGGSAIGGDFIRAYMESFSHVPVFVCRDYSVPPYIGPDSLCIASSYSGNTEETLSAFSLCMQKGATVAAVSTGGKLCRMAHEKGCPHFSIPGGFQPRSALGYSFGALFVLMQRAGLIEEDPSVLMSAVNILKQCLEKWPVGRGLPAELALFLKDRMPVIYGAPGWLSVMAYRWKCQLNENAKLIVPWAFFPEMNHNEIVGWDAPEEFLNKMSALILSDPDGDPRINARIELTAGLMGKKASVRVLQAGGQTMIEKIFYMILLGDLTAIYLTYLYGRDPARIDSIHWLKERLSEKNGIIAGKD